MTYTIERMVASDDEYRMAMNMEASRAELVQLFKRRIDLLEAKSEKEGAHLLAYFCFMQDMCPELIPSFVEYAYTKGEVWGVESPRDLVEGFHDTALDLSKVECTGSDFKPWK